MLRLSAATVRRSWPLYTGALVALAAGSALLATAVAVSAAVDATLTASGTPAAQRTRLSDLASLFGVMGAIATFMAVFVVGSTFGFVVAARRRQLGLLRLVGATPGQVRRMVLAESALVGAVAVAAGCLLSTAATPVSLAVLRRTGVIDIELAPGPPWLPWSVAAPTTSAVALLGSWRASKRASRTTPVAALHEAGVERRRPTFWQLAIGSTCTVGVLVAVAVARELPPVLSLVVAVLLPQVLVVGLYCFGSLTIPAGAALLARPFVTRSVPARLARDHMRAAVRTPVAVAAPIIAISGIAGSLVLTLSLTADWATALDRRQLAAPYVVDTAGD
ncbi:MAG: FtsX-like permease family protein, partial [Phycicoccus sp.]